MPLDRPPLSRCIRNRGDIIPEDPDITPEAMGIMSEEMDIIPEDPDITLVGLGIIPEGTDIIPEEMGVVVITRNSLGPVPAI